MCANKQVNMKKALVN